MMLEISIKIQIIQNLQKGIWRFTKKPWALKLRTWKVKKITAGIFCPKVFKKRLISSSFAVTVEFNIRLKTNS